MRIEARFVGVEASEALVEFMQRHAGFALGRFSTRISRLLVKFEDVNGPRGGEGRVCRMEAVGGFGVRLVSARGDDFYVTALRALDMLERSVARALARRLTLVHGASGRLRRRRA